MEYYSFGGGTTFTPQGELFLLNWPLLTWNGVYFFSTQPLTDWDSSLNVTYPSTAFVEVDCLAGQLLVVSRRLREFLERETPGVIQFLPLRLRRADGADPVEGYYLAHVLVAVDCLDRERTTVRDAKWKMNRDGWYDIVHGITLDRRLMGDHRLFRVAGCPAMLIVREDLRRAMEQEQFTGCAFEDRVLTG